MRPTVAPRCIARLWLAELHVVLVGASSCGVPLSLATLKFSLRRHEGYPQALVLGLVPPLTLFAFLGGEIETDCGDQSHEGHEKAESEIPFRHFFTDLNNTA